MLPRAKKLDLGARGFLYCLMKVRDDQVSTRCQTTESHSYPKISQQTLVLIFVFKQREQERKREAVVLFANEYF